MENWRPVQDLKAELSAQGWTARKIETEDGCYEVRGTNAKGASVEILFDPASFALIGPDD